MTFKEKDLFVKILRIYAFQKFLAPFPFKIKKVFNFECQIYKEENQQVLSRDNSNFCGRPVTIPRQKFGTRRYGLYPKSFLNV
jgi:hypothetical protein